jgi:hypothetical protein
VSIPMPFTFFRNLFFTELERPVGMRPASLQLWPHSFIEPRSGGKKIAGGERFLQAPGEPSLGKEPWKGEGRFILSPLPGLSFQTKAKYKISSPKSKWH